MDLILGLVTLEATRWTANKTKYNARHVHREVLLNRYHKVFWSSGSQAPHETEKLKYRTVFHLDETKRKQPQYNVDGESRGPKLERNRQPEDSIEEEFAHSRICTNPPF